MMQLERMKFSLAACALLSCCGCKPAAESAQAPASTAAPQTTAQASVVAAFRPVNDLPNPYERMEPWGELPASMKSWSALSGAEPGPDGNIYVLHRCFENSCDGRPEPPILKLDPNGKLLKSWGEHMFVWPHGFHIDSAGNVWVTDARGDGKQGHQVFKFSADGKLLMTLGQAGVAGTGPDKFNEPTDVVTGANGDIFVTDGHGAPSNRVVKFSADGTYLKEWGGFGALPGQLNRPHTIAVDSQGRLFVGDRSNNRIQIFDQDGKFLDQWTQFSRPSGIYITADDTIYVADSESWGSDNPAWKKGIRIGSAKDGSVREFIEDVESTDIEHSGAESVGVDAQGNVYGSVVRRRTLEKHVRRKSS
jgi:sugar lactone lactonase YvrE